MHHIDLLTFDYVWCEVEFSRVTAETNGSKPVLGSGGCPEE